MEFIHRRNAQRIPTSLVTDEIKELVGGEQVEVIVTIDEQEYDKAREELISEAQGDFFFVLTLTKGWYLIKVSVTSSLKPEKWQFIVNYWVGQNLFARNWTQSLFLLLCSLGILGPQLSLRQFTFSSKEAYLCWGRMGRGKRDFPLPIVLREASTAETPDEERQLRSFASPFTLSLILIYRFSQG